MKKFTLLAIALVSFTFAFAQQKSTTIKTNPLSLAVGNINLSVEKAVGEQTSFQMQAGYWLGGSVGDTKFSGFFLTPEFRFYMTDHGVPQGFYLAPFLRYESLSAKSKESAFSTEGKATLSRIGGGAGIGYQFLFGDKITWDIFMGPKYMSNKVKYSDGSSSETIDVDRFAGNFGLRFGTTVGIAF